MKYWHFLPAVLLASSIAFAATSDESTQNPHHKKAKKKTVGEILQQADRGGSLGADQKAKTSLPTFADQFSRGYKPATEDLAQIKPPRTASFMEDATDDKAKLEKITDEQIQELYKLVQRFKNSPKRGELWLRLAELYVEKAGIIDFRRQTDYDQKLRDFRAGSRKEKPVLDLRDAKEFNRKAIQLYEWFVRDFPRDEKIDQALFFLGYNYFELNDLKKGLAYYSRLTKDYPQSSYVIESHFALAEYYFENEKWKQAGEHYREVAGHPRHRLAGFSSYKMAWCYFRSGHTQPAIKILEGLVRAGRAQEQQDAEGRKVSKQRLEHEALRDLVLFYSDEGRPSQAPDYFTNLAGSEAPTYIEKLAYVYSEKGQRDGARDLFNWLVAKDPTKAKAFDYKYQVIQAYASAARTKEFREELYQWVHDFGPSGAWYAANKANTSLIDSSTKLRETTLKTWVLTQHQTAQNSHAKFSQGLAYEGYKVYLQEFPNSTAAPDMHFFFAELLYDMEKFDEAGAQYQWVMDNAPVSKYASRAAENIMLSLEHAVPKDKEIAALVGKSLDPVAFSVHTQKFVDAANKYIAAYPKGAKTAEMKFRVGRLYYQHNQFDQAIPHFKAIVHDYPKTKYAEYSANLLLDSYNLKKDYAGLESTGQELLASPNINNSAAGKDIRDVIQKAQFKKAQDLEASKDYLGSAQQFEAFAAQNPHVPLASAATFNAAINYERANQNKKAIENHQLILSSSAKEAAPFKEKSRRLIAKLYQDSGQLLEAAKAFHAAAVDSGSDPLAPNLYYDAAVLFELVGHNEEASSNYLASYQKSKKADRADSLYQVAKIHLREGQTKIAAQHFKDYFNQAPTLTEKSVEAAYYVWKHANDNQENREALIWRSKVLNTQSKLSPGKKGPGAQWAAKVLLVDDYVVYNEMRNLKIPTDTRKQQKAVQKKIELLTELNKKLLDLIKYDSADEIVEALVLSAKANEQMGEALVSAPIPAGFKPEEEKAYRAGIQKLAEPFFSKAKESARGAVDRGQDLEAYGPYLNQAREMLKLYDPSSVQDHGEVSQDLRAVGWTVSQ